MLRTPLLDPQGYSGPCSHPDWGCPPSLGTSGGPWAAWMPPAVAGLSGTCVAVPCRFGYPEELRPATVHGLWYFGSPYPKNYPPVVARSRTGAVHESFTGRAKLVGDPGVRDCSLLLGPLSPELAGKYYFRGDLGGYNQYSFSEHTILEVLGEFGGGDTWIPGSSFFRGSGYLGPLWERGGEGARVLGTPF